MARKLKPVHPGEILREEFMKPLGLSMNKLALDLRVPVTRIAEIVHERRAVTANTALRLGRYFKTTPVFWMNLQVRYDLRSGGRRAGGKDCSGRAALGSIRLTGPLSPFRHALRVTPIKGPPVPDMCQISATARDSKPAPMAVPVSCASGSSML